VRDFLPHDLGRPAIMGKHQQVRLVLGQPQVAQATSRLERIIAARLPLQPVVRAVHNIVPRIRDVHGRRLFTFRGHAAQLNKPFWGVRDWGDHVELVAPGGDIAARGDNISSRRLDVDAAAQLAGPVRHARMAGGQFQEDVPPTSRGQSFHRARERTVGDLQIEQRYFPVIPHVDVHHE